MCTAIWSAANEKYQYSWAPQMSAICKVNGEPSPPATTTTTASPKSTQNGKKVEEKPIKRQVLINSLIVLRLLHMSIFFNTVFALIIAPLLFAPCSLYLLG